MEKECIRHGLQLTDCGISPPDKEEVERLKRESIKHRIMYRKGSKLLIPRKVYDFCDMKIETILPLTEELEDHFKGRKRIENVYKALQKALKTTFSLSQKLDNLFWMPDKGYILREKWREIVGEKVLSFQQSVTARAEELNTPPHSFWPILRGNKDFIEFSESKEYLALQHSTRHQGKSKIEHKVMGFLSEHGEKALWGEYLFTSSRVNQKFEIDLYLPDRGMAFEFNGFFWHSAANGKDKGYHKMKSDVCQGQGVKLYHLWEAPEEKILGFVKQKLGLCKKVHARKTEVRKLPVGEANTLLNLWHMEWGTLSSQAYGLFLDGDCISVMTFRGHKEGIEIARFATKTGLTVTGGFSRLLAHAIPELKREGHSVLISYCNRDLTPDWHDSVYHKQGFEFLGDTGSSLRYLCNKTQGELSGKGVYPRQKFQKHKLKDMFPDYNGQNVRSFLESKQIFEVWNSGNWKFRLPL
jgi:hypothetical protein